MNELLEKLLKMAHEWEVKTGYDYCSGASSARQECVNELRDVVQSFQQSVQRTACTCDVPWLPIGGEGCERCGGFVEASRR